MTKRAKQEIGKWRIAEWRSLDAEAWAIESYTAVDQQRKDL
jgi:hypothetical protein